VANLPAGYAFKLDTTMSELKAKLKKLGHGQWEDWESNSYGDYIFGELWGMHMRIFDGQGTQSDFGTYDPQGYMLLDYARGESMKRTEEHHIKIVDILFPALGITEWKPDDGND
jgi:hypothetical protein